MMQMTARFLILSMVLAVASATWAADRYVVWDNAANADSPFISWATAATNIQDAIDIAGDGDVIWVAPGTYGVSTNPGTGYNGETNVVTISELSLTLRSSNGVPGDTVIDGGERYRGIYPYPGSGERVLIDGFTISNCWALNGAGMAIRAENSRTVTVHNCVFTSNTASTAGGGVSIWNPKDSSRSLDYAFSNCVFVGNQVTNGSAAALHNVVRGGGKQGLIVDCTIVSNRAHTTGWNHPGGMYFRSGNVVIDRSTFIQNVAVGSSGRGGAIACRAGEVRIRNSLFQANSTDGPVNASAVYMDAGCRLTLENCTVADNSGVAIRVKPDASGNSDIWCVNSVVYNNSIDVDSNKGNYQFTNSVVPVGTTVSNNVNVIFTNTPGFVDAINHNYRLARGTVCINAGTNQSWMTGAVDLDGSARIDSGIVDIGAYEYRTLGTTIMVR